LPAGVVASIPFGKADERDTKSLQIVEQRDQMPEIAPQSIELPVVAERQRFDVLVCWRQTGVETDECSRTAIWPIGNSRSVPKLRQIT
jgi:hypothetical protein